MDRTSAHRCSCTPTGRSRSNRFTIGHGTPHSTHASLALCWLFHLVGDVHQPLHTTALFTSDYPDGDKGGKLVFVRARAGGAILNLHALWDGLILGGQRFQEVRNTATELRLRPEFAKGKLTELSETDFEQWAKASFDLAVKLAYLDGKVPGSPKRDEAPAVPDGYTTAAKAAAERQVVLAGYRLAEMLKAAAPQ